VMARAGCTVTAETAATVPVIRSRTSTSLLPAALRFLRTEILPS
jgi:hypothetical protein